MKIFLATLLLVSLAANAFLWNASSKQRSELAVLQENAGKLEELLRQNQELQAAQANKAGATSEADMKELARLRNEVSQLRKTASEVPALNAQAAQLRAQLASASQSLAQKEKDLSAAATTAEQSEQITQAKQRAQSIMCMNNMKQIGLAARLWANDHTGTFPPDLATMRNELVTPKVLFCPAAPSAPATDWTQLTPAAISYQFLNPNGNEADPQKPLTTCPIHGHVGMSDGSVQAARK
jgi:hypothetical protein